MTESRVVRFRSRRPPSLIVEAFPDHREGIEVLWRGNEEFREVCADFLTARSSLVRTERSNLTQTAIQTYQDLVEELRQELLAFLSSPHPHES